MNKILQDIVELKNGNYCHALEVQDVGELQTTIENLVDEFSENYSKNEIVEFFDTIEIYCLSDENETAIFNFNIANFIDTLI